MLTDIKYMHSSNLGFETSKVYQIVVDFKFQPFTKFGVTPKTSALAFRGNGKRRDLLLTYSCSTL